MRIADRLKPVLLLPLCAAAQSLPSADELVARHLAAMGGADKLAAVKTVKMTATGSANGMEVPITVYLKRPGMMRTESNVQGQSIVQAFDGTRSWSINPLMGPGGPAYGGEQESRNARERAFSQIEGHLVDYKARGSTVEVQGKEYLEGSQVYKVKITTQGGSAIWEYLDADTYLDAKTVVQVYQGGHDVEVTSYPSNYKRVAGVLLPHQIDQRIGDLPAMKMAIAKIEVNLPLDDAIFRLPQ
jgi:outer membrane lipoprotein-sorting protein